MNRFCVFRVVFMVWLLNYVEGRSRSDVAVKGFLVPQNEARKAVGVPPLAWDRKLTTYARNYARQRRGDCLLQHSEGSPYGENIFWGSGRNWTPEEAVGAWIDEGKWYEHGNNSCNGDHECSHYTQVVWRTSTRVGCAVIRCHLASECPIQKCKIEDIVHWWMDDLPLHLEVRGEVNFSKDSEPKEVEVEGDVNFEHHFESRNSGASNPQQGPALSLYKFGVPFKSPSNLPSQ
ncbi:hypothetical protein KI387_009269, partial [Taxus chinensis]